MTFPPEAREVVDAAVADGAVPGAVAAVTASDGRMAVHARGLRRRGGEATSADTCYDLASLTKVVATLPSLLRLVAAGEVDLDDRLERFFSNAGWFQTPSLADATVRQLLAHASGVQAWWPLFAQVSTRATAVAAVLQARIDAPGRLRYSDIAFMILGALVERVSGQRLDAFARTAVFEPLNLHGIGFGPVEDRPVAATEHCGWRNRLLEGEVHDENAVVWEGVAGHAGLFGTAEELARYASAWLRFDSALGPEQLLREAVTLQAEGEDGVRRGLGWLLGHPTVFAGPAARGFGHTGFTGTSLWIDPEAGVASLLLTNRVHPHRSLGDRVGPLRERYHGAAHGLDHGAAA